MRKTVMTIHNIAFQGNFDRDWLKPLDLPQSCLTCMVWSFTATCRF